MNETVSEGRPRALILDTTSFFGSEHMWSLGTCIIITERDTFEPPFRRAEDRNSISSSNSMTALGIPSADCMRLLIAGRIRISTPSGWSPPRPVYGFPGRHIKALKQATGKRLMTAPPVCSTALYPRRWASGPTP
ncbi:hypothetical protein SDC9_208731 [bioreactor metagenome]|uniref:Uncharacterized protein n=1 Tax=bioreactor metagenome TaxID=1076179 RepID=A0A645JCD9_9ZZZZ